LTAVFHTVIACVIGANSVRVRVARERSAPLGKKLYAVHDKQGRFKDIQSYKRAHGQDVGEGAKKKKNV
jgi:hypothetical protein